MIFLFVYSSMRVQNVSLTDVGFLHLLQLLRLEFFI